MHFLRKKYIDKSLHSLLFFLNSNDQLKITILTNFLKSYINDKKEIQILIAKYKIFETNTIILAIKYMIKLNNYQNNVINEFYSFFLGCLILSRKYLTDCGFTNEKYSKIFKTTIYKINYVEITIITILNFNLLITEKEYTMLLKYFLTKI